ncbi:hypothetical protein Taro_021827 [Colocasia esculenta]|uniref:Uncharacterized protein n=1 Tax=Colocasia esculenta TaxID=4460 RepID=A0A843V3I9_COLES|nr:hypothetical protein [Colocasia esculenta]
MGSSHPELQTPWPEITYPHGFELPHLALHQTIVAFTINYLHLLYVIPLEHTKDLVALRNLGFEFPSIKNNDYPRGSLAARMGHYAWHSIPATLHFATLHFFHFTSLHHTPFHSTLCPFALFPYKADAKAW